MARRRHHRPSESLLRKFFLFGILPNLIVAAAIGIATGALGYDPFVKLGQVGTQAVKYASSLQTNQKPTTPTQRPPSGPGLTVLSRRLWPSE